METFAVYENTILPRGVNADGLKRDKDGFVKVCVGAFDCYNNVGEFYEYTERVKAVFDQSSRFQRYVNKGLVKGEISHPEPWAGMTKQQWLRRNWDFDPLRVNQAFRRFELVKGKDDRGKPIILVMADVIEDGQCAMSMKQVLDHAEVNAAWSFRGITLPKKDAMGRVTSREVIEAITYDSVPIGGFDQATKHDTLKLNRSSGGILLSAGPEAKCLTETRFSSLELDIMEREEALNPVTTESHFSTTMVRSTLGWQKIQLINPDTFRGF